MEKDNIEATDEKTPVEKNSDGDKPVEFRAKRHTASALTWFACGLLLIPCYIETKIIAMILLMPFMFILAVGFLLEGKKSAVCINGQEITFSDGTAFKSTKTTLASKKIVSAFIDSTKEKNDEIIHSIRLMTTAGPVAVPDIDDKQGLLDALKKVRPGLKIERI